MTSVLLGLAWRDSVILVVLVDSPHFKQIFSSQHVTYEGHWGLDAGWTMQV